MNQPPLNDSDLNSADKVFQEIDKLLCPRNCGENGACETGKIGLHMYSQVSHKIY